MRRPRLGRLGGMLALAALGAAGCTRSMWLPDLHGLYSAAAQRHGSARNPVIVIPGILGSATPSISGLPLEAAAYVNILAALGVGGYRDQTLGNLARVDYGAGHFTCFQFDYDWRRDLAENARRLAAFVREKRAYVQAELVRETGVRDVAVRFDIVAHSMGGLLTRYYLRYGGQDLPADGSLPATTWEGARDEDARRRAPPSSASARR